MPFNWPSGHCVERTNKFFVHNLAHVRSRLAITQAWQDFACFVPILFRVSFKIDPRRIMSEKQPRSRIEQATVLGFELTTLFENLFACSGHRLTVAQHQAMVDEISDNTQNPGD